MSTQQTGNATTVTFSASGFSADVRSVRIGGFEYPVLDGTLLSTTEARAKIIGALRDEQPITLTCVCDPSEAVPTDADAETLTINVAGQGSFSGPGAITKWGDVDVNSDDLLEVEVTFTPTGAWTYPS